MEQLGLILPQAPKVPPGVGIPFAWVRLHVDRAYLSSFKRALGDLDRITAWLLVSGMVSVAPGFTQTTHVINGCSDLLLEVSGAEVGLHARTAIGMAQLPLDLPVFIAAEVAVR